MPIRMGWREAMALRDAKAEVYVFAHEKNILVTWPRGRAVLDVQKNLSRFGIAEVAVLESQTQGDKTWALLSVSPMSRGRPGGGFCGAGTEGDLVWLELGAGIEKTGTEPIASCLHTISAVLVSLSIPSSSSSARRSTATPAPTASASIADVPSAASWQAGVGLGAEPTHDVPGMTELPPAKERCSASCPRQA